MQNIKFFIEKKFEKYDEKLKLLEKKLEKQKENHTNLLRDLAHVFSNFAEN